MPVPMPMSLLSCAVQRMTQVIFYIYCAKTQGKAALIHTSSFHHSCFHHFKLHAPVRKRGKFSHSFIHSHALFPYEFARNHLATL